MTSSSIANARATLSSSHPELNVLITAAGIMRPESVLGPDSLAVAEATITTNLLGTIRVIDAFLPALAAQQDAAILTVSSGLAFVPLPLTPTYNATKAGIHSYSEALRVQLAGSSVQIIELVPPAVRTTLMGQENSELAMPLDDYLTETMALLDSQPAAEQILVDNVKQLRFAETDGSYADILTMFAGH